MFSFGDEQLTMNEFLARENQFKEWNDNTYKAVIQWFVDPKNNPLPTYKTICPHLKDYSDKNKILVRWIRQSGMNAYLYDINEDTVPGPLYVAVEDIITEAVEDLFQLVLTLKSGGQYVIRRGASFGKHLLGRYEWGGRMYDDMEINYDTYTKTCEIIAGTFPMCSAEIIININDIERITQK